MSYWYNEKLGNENITISTRIRLARNIRNIPFPSKMSNTDRAKLNKTVKDAIDKSDICKKYELKYIDMSDVPEIERFAMLERHTISRDFAENYTDRAIIISSDEKISILIGEEDHIRIQVIAAGKDFDNSYAIANEIDDCLCENLDIAFNDKFGFLTECPTNVGTGLRISAMMHLPLIESYGKIPYLQEWLNKIGFTIRGTYGEGSKVYSSLYQISNQVTLGISEIDTISQLRSIVDKLTSQESDFRKQINKQKLEDDCYRSLYLLKGARLMSSNEMMTLLSKTMIGQNCGIIDGDAINPISALINCQPYMLISRFGTNDAAERDAARANYLRENIKL